MKKILVTGAAGFIGSHLVETLLEKNKKVVALVKYNSSNDIGFLNKINVSKKKNLEIFMGDIRDYDSIESAAKGCDTIFNLAAMISVQYSFKFPQSYLDTNIYGLMNLLRASNYLKKNIKKIVQVSSSEVYGNLVLNKKIKKLNEKDNLFAESPYAASKIAADNLALTMFKACGIPISIIRPFNTFGPRQSMRAIIPTIIAQLTNNQKKNLKIGNLNSSRDFVYVNDTVSAMLKVAEKGKNGEVYNVANGKSFSVKDIIKIVEDYLGVEAKIILDKKRMRKADVFDLIGDNSKIKKLGWKPQYANFDGFQRGIIKTIKWIEQNQSYFKDTSKYYL